METFRKRTHALPARPAVAALALAVLASLAVVPPQLAGAPEPGFSEVLAAALAPNERCLAAFGRACKLVDTRRVRTYRVAASGRCTRVGVLPVTAISVTGMILVQP